MKSPARAPERRMACPAGTEPSTTMSAKTPSGDCAVSPPARRTENRVASFSNPATKRSTHSCGSSAGSASERNAALRNASHRSDVAESARQATMPDGIWRMPVTAEVHAFEVEVGGEQRLVPAWNRQNCTVVADASARMFASRHSCTSNALDEQFFASSGTRYPPRHKAFSANIRDP